MLLNCKSTEGRLASVEMLPVIFKWLINDDDDVLSTYLNAKEDPAEHAYLHINMAEGEESSCKTALE